MALSSLIEEMPKIVSEGKKEAERIMEMLSGFNTIGFQINELVIPSKDISGLEKGKSGVYKKQDWYNRLIQGDNLLAIGVLLSGDEESRLPSLKGKIDLIYIDPPFDSKADYKRKVTLPSGDIGKKLLTIEQFAYSDTWKEGTESYLKMIYPRLMLMRELLSNQGSIYVHLDWHVSHYVKLLLDDIFGRDRFVNEIVWSYKSGGVSSRYFARKHDTILLYSKSDKYTFNVQKEKSYNRGFKPYRFKGVQEFQDEIGWHTFVNMKDVWEIDMVGRTSRERIGYATQKPEALLERIITASTNKDSIVADFFGGSGTTAAVAERLGRRWIISDIGKHSCTVMQKRLIDKNAKSFIYHSVGDYENKTIALNKISQIVLKPIKRVEASDDTEKLIIELDTYTLFSPETLPLEDKYKEEFKVIMKRDPLALIEYWSIDPDYNEEIFISRWQDYRENKDNDSDEFKIITKVELQVPKKYGQRIVCVKTVDLFGFESVVIENVK